MIFENKNGADQAEQVGQAGLRLGSLCAAKSGFLVARSLSLLYLFFISRFICSRRRCIDKLGVIHANQISMCLDPHLN